MKKNIFEKYNEIFKLFLRNLLIIFIILFVLESFTNVVVFKFLNQDFLTFGIFLTFSFLLFLHFKKNEEKAKTKYEKFFKYFFIFGLFLITFNSLEFEGLKRFENFELIKQLLNNLTLYITLLTILSGFFTFFFNKKRIGKEIEKDEESKKKVKEKLKAVFPTKILRKFFTWFLKNGWYVVGVSCIFILFLSVRLYMFTFDCSFGDEYRHIISGMHLFEHREFPTINNHNEPYTRGAQMSFLIGFYMLIFGQTMTVAKLVPITLGTLNFLMLHQISKSFLSNKALRLIYLLVFSLCSWTILNHFFIREYVFAEFSIILVLFLGLKIYDCLKPPIQKSRILLYLLLITSLTLINCNYSGRGVKEIAPIIFISLLIGLFFLSPPSFKNQFFTFLTNHMGKKAIKFITAVILILPIALIFLNLNWFLGNFHWLTQATMRPSTHQLGFDGFFLNINLIFTVLSLLSFFIVLLLKDAKKMLLFITIYPMLLLHKISSEDLQIIRGMMYIFPLFFLSAFLALEKLLKLKPKKIIYAITFLVIFSFLPILYKNYELVFLNRTFPGIPGEMSQGDYRKKYTWKSKYLGDYTVFAAEYLIAYESFYDFKYDYKLDFLNRSSNYAVDKEGIKRHPFTNTEIITEFEVFKNITQQEKSCVVYKGFSREHFLGQEADWYIKNNFDKVAEGASYIIYCN